MKLKLYKIENGNLISTESTYISLDNGLFINNKKTEEELKGYKPLIVEYVGTPNVYQDVSIEYVENDNNIIEVHNIVNKTIEEIILINESFWNENYLKVETLGDIYIPYKNYLNNTEYDAIRDELPIIISCIQSGVVYLNGITVYDSPDFTKEFNEEYLSGLRKTIKDESSISSYVDFIYDKISQTRNIPKMI